MLVDENRFVSGIDVSDLVDPLLLDTEMPFFSFIDTKMLFFFLF